MKLEGEYLRQVEDLATGGKLGYTVDPVEIILNLTDGWTKKSNAQGYFGCNYGATVVMCMPLIHSVTVEVPLRNLRKLLGDSTVQGYMLPKDIHLMDASFPFKVE